MSKILQAIETLQNNGVYILPTETVYGLFTKTNIQAIYDIKQRPNNLLLAIYLDKIPSWLREHAQWPLLSQYLPGPLAIVYNNQCYRFTNNPVLRYIISKVEFLYGTSANLHGGLSCNHANMLNLNIPHINMGNTLYGYETTIIDIDKMHILRHGVIDMRMHCTYEPFSVIEHSTKPSKLIFNRLLQKHKNIFFYFYTYLYYYGRTGIDYICTNTYAAVVLNQHIHKIIS